MDLHCTESFSTFLTTLPGQYELVEFIKAKVCYLQCFASCLDLCGLFALFCFLFAVDFAISQIRRLELHGGFIWIELADMVLKVCGLHRIWILLFAVINSHRIYLLSHLGFRLLELRKVVIVELQLKSLRIFQTLLNCCQVFISCVSLHTFIVVHHYFGMELSFIGLMRIKQSNQQGLKHCQAFDKGFTLHPSIMLTTGESEEVNKEESILEL